MWNVLPESSTTIAADFTRRVVRTRAATSSWLCRRFCSTRKHAADDLSTPDGWWKAVLTYNQSVAYGQDVFSGSDAYAAASLTP